MQSIPICVVTVLMLLTQGRPSHTIIGKWQAVEAADGVSHTIEFSRGGLLSQTGGIIASGTYTLDGNRIILDKELTGGVDTAPEVSEFRIEGNELVLKDDGGEMRLPRIGRQPPNAPAIVGKWGEKGAFFHGGKNGSATFEFTQDGRVTFRMQAEPEKGRYQTRGNRIITRMHGESSAGSFRFEDGFLILKSLSEPGREEKYKRVER